MLHFIRNLFSRSTARKHDVANSPEHSTVSVRASSVFASAADSTAGHFVDGPLVKAIRDGDVVCLDEVDSDDDSTERELSVDRTYQVDPELTAELERIRLELTQSPAELLLADRMHAFSC